MLSYIFFGEDRKKSKRRFFETRQRCGKKRKERKRSERVIVTDLATDGTDERDGNALLAFGKKERKRGRNRKEKKKKGEEEEKKVKKDVRWFV